MIFAISLCRKAGMLVTGFDAVKEAVFRGTACLVLVASDVSEGTRRRVEAFCEEEGAELLPLGRTQAEAARVLRKPAGVFAVVDPELAKLCRKSVGGNAGAPRQNKKEESPCQ